MNDKAPAYNRLEQVIAHLVKFPEPEKVYELYLKGVIDRLDQREWGPKERERLRKNSHESRVRLLAAILKSHALFQELLELLPREVVALIYICAHEGDRHDLNLVWKKVGQLLDVEASEEMKAIQMLFLSARTHPAFFLFQIKNNWTTWGYDREVSYISLNSLLNSAILRLLPKHPLCHLRPVSRINKAGLMVYRDDGAIFQQLPVILAFISQDNLQYSKNGEKILMRSLQKMAAVCGIKEFYAAGDTNAVKLMKTSFFAEFLSCGATWTTDDLDDIPRFIKQRMDRFFKFQDFKSYRCRELFHYIKRQMVEFGGEADEKKMRASIRKMFTMLPPEKWVSTHDVARAAFYSHMDFNPFSRNQEFQSLYIRSDFEIDAATRIEKKLEVYRAYKFDVLTLPFVKGILFLLGALGLVDLGYTQPKNRIYRQLGKPWLSIYDGLKYVRLTAFGNYVAGRTDHFSANVEIKSAEIELDNQSTILTIYGEDPVKKLALEQLGEPINGSSYVVSYPTFLRECTTTMDVENKIQFFREHISPNPPEIWEKFFKAALARMNPLESVSDISVFRVKPDGELISLLTKDPVLKQHVIKAENYHLLVETVHLPKVKKRLGQFGFFMTPGED